MEASVKASVKTQVTRFSKDVLRNQSWFIGISVNNNLQGVLPTRAGIANRSANAYKRNLLSQRFKKFIAAKLA